jgi:hypothetical protein
MKKTIFLILSSLSIILTGFWFYQDYQAEADIVAEEGVLPGKLSPSFSLEDLNGNNITTILFLLIFRLIRHNVMFILLPISFTTNLYSKQQY